MLRILTAFSISVHGNSFLQLIQVENYEIILISVFLSYHTKIHFTLSSECINNLTTFHHYYISNATVVGQAIIIPYMDDYNNLLTGFHVCPFKSTQDRCPDEFFFKCKSDDAILLLAIIFIWYRASSTSLKRPCEILHDLYLPTVSLNSSSFSLFSSCTGLFVVQGKC